MQEVSYLFQNEIVCLNSQICYYICMNDQCKHSLLFFCKNEQCQCQQKHVNCQKQSIANFLHMVQHKQNEIKHKYEKSLVSILKIYDQIIDLLSHKRNDFETFFTKFGMGIYTKKFMQSIEEKKCQNISRSLIQNIKQQLSLDEQQLIYAQVSMIDITKQLVSTKVDEVILELTAFEYQPFEMSINSKIIVQNQKASIEKICRFFGKPVKKLDLLYRGSQQQFNIDKFHEKCDGKAQTLLIVETEQGKIIGGYTPIQWKSSQYTLTADQSGSSFLFSITLNEKYRLKDKRKAVIHDRQLGPIFGGGPDLRIGGQKDGLFGDYTLTYFPYSYNNGKYQSSYDTYNTFTGSTNGEYFYFKQYQIFQVIWQ